MRKSLATFLCSVLLIGVIPPAFGALGSPAVFQVQNGGSDTTGAGCYSSGAEVTSPGTNESLNNSSTSVSITLTGTGTTGTSSPVFTTTTHGPGNCILITGGSGCTTGLFELKSQASGTGTFDRSMGTAASVCTGFLGGAFASPGEACLQAASGNTIFVLAGTTFGITSASTGAAGVCSTSTNLITIIGYSTNRSFASAYGDTQPTLQTQVNSSTMFTSANNSLLVYNMILDGNNGGGFTGSKLASTAYVIGSTVENFNTASTGVVSGRSNYITGNSAAVFIGGALNYSEITGNTVPAAVSMTALTNDLCYAETATSCATIVNGAIVEGLTAVGITGSGVASTAANGQRVIANSYFQSNTVDGILCTGSRCATFGVGFFGNGATIGGAFDSTGTISPGADAFTNTAGNVFTLNSGAAGLSLRGTGTPNIFPRGLTANSRDVNAAQSAPGGQVVY